MTDTTNNNSKTRLAVYTVLVGQKESLNDPLQIISDRAATDLEIDFYCFTDNLQLESNSWKFRYYSHPLIPAEKSSRLPKACPDRFFPDYEYSLYIDNTVVFKRLPTLEDIKNSLFKGFRHPWRTNPVDEADIVVKSRLDDASTVASQMEFYEQQRHVSNIKRLTAGTVLLRKHNDENVKNFGVLWWEQILLFSKRDQLSLDLCAQEAACPVEYFSGDKLTNDLFLWPVIAKGHRVEGSFDADYYAWKNRAIPEAVLDPRQHFLKHKRDESIKFNKKTSMFDYACMRTRSSLGRNVSPRRGVAEIIERNLIQANKPEKILIVGVQSNTYASVESSELSAAKEAFVQFYKFEEKPLINSTLIVESDMLNEAPFLQAHGMSDYDLVIVLGMTSSCITNGIAKFIKLLNINGTLMIEFNLSLSTQEILKMHSKIKYFGNLEIFHGQHVTLDSVLPSSVFNFKKNIEI